MNDPTTSADPTDLTSVLAGYARDGFTVQFTLEEPGGRLTCHACERSTAPGEVELTSLRRLEGESDPADMSAVLALHCPHCHAAGTAVVRFGPEASEGTAALLQSLSDERGAASVPAGRPTSEPAVVPGPDRADGRRLVRSSAPGSSLAEGVELTGGADAIPRTPADDGRAGRNGPLDPVEPPAPG